MGSASSPTLLMRKRNKTNRRSWLILRAIHRAIAPKLAALREAQNMLDDYDVYRKQTLC